MCAPTHVGAHLCVRPRKGTPACVPARRGRHAGLPLPYGLPEAAALQVRLHVKDADFAAGEGQRDGEVGVGAHGGYPWVHYSHPKVVR